MIETAQPFVNRPKIDESLPPFSPVLPELKSEHYAASAESHAEDVLLKDLTKLNLKARPDPAQTHGNFPFCSFTFTNSICRY